jgi:deoxyribose-phosphate aldolase
MLAQLPVHLQNEAAFAALFDHTNLKPDATLQQIMTLCDEAVSHKFKGVCVNPCYIKPAVARLGNSGRIAMAVVGFPLGANRTDIKVDEAKRAIGDGAGELDMVINVGLYISGEKTQVRSDIEQVVKAAGTVPVKVILETCFLTPAQITELSKWCVEVGAAFVKTSTGFAARGASIEDIAAMRVATDGSKTTIKASGGIRSIDAAIMMAKAGATRIGSSSTVAILDAFRALKNS